MAFGLAFGSILVWAACGHVFHYSEDWQLVINTGTTIVTFLMVFLIQNAQNRDSKATQLKLNELIRAMKGARNECLNLEEMTDEELEQLHAEFKAIHDEIRSHIAKRERRDQGSAR